MFDIELDCSDGFKSELSHISDETREEEIASLLSSSIFRDVNWCSRGCFSDDIMFFFRHIIVHFWCNID